MASIIGGLGYDSNSIIFVSISLDAILLNFYMLGDMIHFARLLSMDGMIVATKNNFPSKI